MMSSIFFIKFCFTVQAHKRGKVHTESFLKTPLRGCLIAKHFRTPFLGNFLPPTTKKWALLFIREKKHNGNVCFNLEQMSLFSLSFRANLATLILIFESQKFCARARMRDCKNNDDRFVVKLFLMVKELL